MEKKKREEKTADVYDLILKYQTAPEEGKEERKCPRCGGPVDATGVCPKCSSEGVADIAFAKPLPEGMRFDNFVVGPNSKFPVAAAVSVADAPSKAYNPLLIFGGSGLGKTHLLSAIAHHIRDKNKSAKVVYVPADRFVEAVGQAGSESVLRKIREDTFNISLLLVDDMQFLAASEPASSRWRSSSTTSLTRRSRSFLRATGSRRRYRGLSDRLNSRIMMGLTVDLQPPDLETRVKILKLKAQDKNLKLRRRDSSTT